MLSRPTVFRRLALPVCFALGWIAAFGKPALIDLDGDGLSDIWQIAFDAEGLSPTGDEDGDGFSNYEECQLGTDPWDAASKFEFIGVEADEEGFAVQFRGAPEQTYYFEVSNDLVNWRDGTDYVTGTGGVDRLVETGDETVRFARFRVGGDQDGDGLSDFDEVQLGFDPLSANSDPSFVGGDMARLMDLYFSDGQFEVAGKTVSGRPPELAEASRFLAQASLGARMPEIEAVAQMGYSGWIDAQFQTEPGYITPRLDWWYENNENVFNVHRHYAWWEQVLESPDLLRQRIAVALSEIYVVSDSALDGRAATDGMANYYDMLLDNSFGSWRKLLCDVSLHPAMGRYLSHMQNRKADAEANTYPDENYAREVMQLFSIGLFELNPDGSRKKDSQGRDIPTYDNDDITAFARVFTGFAFGGDANDTSIEWHFDWGDWNFRAPMKVWEHQHDRDSKRLLNGTVLPSFAQDPGRKAMDDFEDAMDNLFHHPNVGPFISYRLIQRLVKSNPSPGYVQRVANVFADNGAGERGDMKAVIRAILLDIEARSLTAYSDPTAGRLREPYLRWVRLVKTLGAESRDGGMPLIPDWSHLEEMGQRVMSSNSVFNFFLPEYVPPGEMAEAGLVGPEFQILTSTTAMSTQNIFAGAMLWGFGQWEDGVSSMSIEFEDELRILNEEGSAALLDHFDLLLCHGSMSDSTKELLLEAFDNRPSWLEAQRSVAMLARLVVLSPEFSVTQ